jgi:hypothetical protein
MQSVIGANPTLVFGVLSLRFSGRSLERAVAISLALMFAAAVRMPGTRVVDAVQRGEAGLWILPV